MKILDFIENKIIVPIAVTLFMFSCCWMIIESLSRQFLNKSYNFSEELIIFSLIWAIFLTFGKGGRKNVHIVVDLFTSKFKPKTLNIIKTFNSVIGLVYSIFIIYVGISYINHLFNTGITSHSSLRIPMGFVFLAVPIGMLFLGSFYLNEIRNVFRKNEVEESSSISNLQHETSIDSPIEEKVTLEKVEV